MKVDCIYMYLSNFRNTMSFQICLELVLAIFKDLPQYIVPQKYRDITKRCHYWDVFISNNLKSIYADNHDKQLISYDTK